MEMGHAILILTVTATGTPGKIRITMVFGILRIWMETGSWMGSKEIFWEIFSSSGISSSREVTFRRIPMRMVFSKVPYECTRGRAGLAPLNRKRAGVMANGD